MLAVAEDSAKCGRLGLQQEHCGSSEKAWKGGCNSVLAERSQNRRHRELFMAGSEKNESGLIMHMVMFVFMCISDTLQPLTCFWDRRDGEFCVPRVTTNLFSYRG